jgi:hypothetical protein
VDVCSRWSTVEIRDPPAVWCSVQPWSNRCRLVRSRFMCAGSEMRSRPKSIPRVYAPPLCEPTCGCTMKARNVLISRGVDRLATSQDGADSTISGRYSAGPKGATCLDTFGNWDHSFSGRESHFKVSSPVVRWATNCQQPACFRKTRTY